MSTERPNWGRAFSFGVMKWGFIWALEPPLDPFGYETCPPFGVYHQKEDRTTSTSSTRR